MKKTTGKEKKQENDLLGSILGGMGPVAERQQRPQAGAGRARPLASSSASSQPSSSTSLRSARAGAGSSQPLSSPSSSNPAASGSRSFVIPKKPRTEEGSSSSSSSYQKRRTDSNDGPETKKSTIFADPNRVKFSPEKTLNVLLNMFSVDVSKAPEILESFHIDITAVTGRKKKVPLNDKNLYGDTNKTYRRNGLWSVFKAVIRLNPELFSVADPNDSQCHKVAAYDCGACFYMEYGKYKGGDCEPLRLVEEDVKEIDPTLWKPIAKMLRAPLSCIEIEIKRENQKIYTRGEKALGNKNELGRFLDVLSSQVTNDAGFVTFGNVTYPHATEEIDERNRAECEKDGKELRTGFEKSTRITVEGGKMKISTLIDARRSLFYKDLMLIDLLERALNLNSRDRDFEKQIIKKLKSNFPECERKKDEIQNLAFQPTHIMNDKQTDVLIDGFDYRGAENIHFKKTENGIETEISVYNYFLETYRLRLRYPKLLATRSKGNQKTFFPMELLRITPGQRVKTKHVPPRLFMYVTTMMSLSPETHLEFYPRVFHEYLGLGGRAYVMDHFKVAIDTRLEETSAQILEGPTCKFGEGRTSVLLTGIKKTPAVALFEKNGGNNKLFKFIDPCNINSVEFMFFEHPSHKVKKEIEDLIKELINRGCTIRGGAESIKWTVQSKNHHEGIRECMVDAKKRSVSLIIAITEEKKPEVHNTLKMLEAQIGLQTAHLAKDTFLSMGARNKAVTVENVCRKLNLKAGGLNYTTSVSNRLPNYDRLDEKLFKNTMFVGFEMSHAGATLLFDKQNNIACGEPTVVGLAHSLKESTRLGGFSWLQKPREHKIMCLAEHFPKIFHSYHKACNRLPEKVVVYRSGMGEGDYPRVEQEIEEMILSLKEDKKLKSIARGDYQPKMIVLISHQHSHNRVFLKEIPRQGKTHEKNVPSGTYIEKFGGDQYSDFILVSQNALAATIRPTRYTVIRNDSSLSKDEIANMTYISAFGHQVSAQPPGKPAVLYAAENNAKRGKNNLASYRRIRKFERARENRADCVEDDADGNLVHALAEKLAVTNLSYHNFWA